jgi:hypothetical protein
VAAVGSILAGIALVAVARAKNVQWDAEIVEEARS